MEALAASTPQVDFSSMTPEEERVYLERVRAIPAAEVTVEMAVEDRRTDDGVPLRVYRPREMRDEAVIQYVHGGGWIMGNLDMHDRTCRILAERTRLPVVSSTYRLAPEHPFPAAALDTFSALRWIARSGAAEGWNGERIIMAGSSAGGNLVASSTLRAKTEGGPAISMQVLIYPMVDSRMEAKSLRTNGANHPITAAHIAFYWDSYMPDRRVRSDPLASPMHAESLSGLPPALIITAEHDALRDEGEEYGARLRAAGVPVEVHRAPDTLHGFMSYPAFFPQGSDYLNLIADRIGSLLHPPG